MAADAVVGASPGNHEEDERLIHKTMREDLAGGKRPGAAITPGQQLNEKGQCVSSQRYSSIVFF